MKPQATRKHINIQSIDRTQSQLESLARIVKAVLYLAPVTMLLVVIFA